jgi:flagellar basal-body rod modification protein FlgD
MTNAVTSASTSVADAMAAAKAAASTTQSTTGAQTLGKDAFLKLLVAQLKYQDPMNPSSSTEFMSQTAAFTQVEKLDDISTAVSSLSSAQTVLGASGLVGRTVQYTDKDGTDVTGTVSAVRFGASGTTVRVGDTDVAVSAVKEVRSSATGTA